MSRIALINVALGLGIGVALESGCDSRASVHTTPPGGCTLVGPPPTFSLTLSQAGGIKPRDQRRTLRIEVQGGWRRKKNLICELKPRDTMLQAGWGCEPASAKDKGGAMAGIIRTEHGVELDVSYYHRYRVRLSGNKGPRRVKVSVFEHGKRVYTRVFRPSYEQIEINGPGCGTDVFSEPYKDTFVSP